MAFDLGSDQLLQQFLVWNFLDDGSVGLRIRETIQVGIGFSKARGNVPPLLVLPNLSVRDIERVTNFFVTQASLLTSQTKRTASSGIIVWKGGLARIKIAGM